MDVDPPKYVRIIFGTFPTQYPKTVPPSIKREVNLIKFITTPPLSDGFKYYHTEIITPNRERASIHVGPKGVFKTDVNQLHKEYVNCDPKDWHYKLMFAFEIDHIQEEKMNKFFEKHLGDPYSQKNMYINILIKKLFFWSKGLQDELMIDDWNNPNVIKKGWDCVTLTLRFLTEIGVLPDPQMCAEKDRFPLLGVSSHELANIFLDRIPYLREHCGLKFYFSREHQSENVWKTGMKNLFLLGTKKKEGGECGHL